MPRIPTPIERYLFHPLQAIAAFLCYSLFRVLPIDAASALGGWLGRTIGPHLPVSARAVKNLTAAFPEKSAADIKAIQRGMWDNLGRVAAEYPHLEALTFGGADSHVEVVGAEYIDLLRDDGKPGIFFSAHMANWEIAALSAIRRDLSIHLIYRAPNNPWVEHLFRHRQIGEGELIPKGAEGARQAIRLLGGGGHLGMLVDQKMNDGIPVAFFGREAMTAPALAQFALKFGCPVIPSRVERTKGARFRITHLPPMELPQTGDRQADVAALMAQVNRHIEDWVRERPEQWLWLHNRWPD